MAEHPLMLWLGLCAALTIHGLAPRASDCYSGFVDFPGTRHLNAIDMSDRISRFFGLFGIYFSLKYLSLSDATVLTFLAPFCTGIAGAVFLKERYTYREALAGCKSRVPC